MRVTPILALASALALAACGGGEEGTAEEVVPMSEEAIAAEMAEAVVPLAGQYEATIELIDFSMSGVPDEMAERGRAQYAEGLSEGLNFCLTEEDVSEGWKGYSEKMTDGECGFNRFNVNGDQLDAEMACKIGPTEGISTLQGTVTQESQDMTMRMEQNLASIGSVNITTRMQSTRTGDCAE